MIEEVWCAQHQKSMLIDTMMEAPTWRCDGQYKVRGRTFHDEPHSVCVYAKTHEQEMKALRERIEAMPTHHGEDLIRKAELFSVLAELEKVSKE